MNLAGLRELAYTEGPFATVYLVASHDTADAVRTVELGWRDRRDELVAAGADAATLAALDTEVLAILDGPERPVGPAGRVLVAAGGQLRLSQELPDPPDPPRASWSGLPDLLELLAGLPEPLSTVVVVVDTTGADIYTGSHETHVDPDRRALHQVRGGGLAHLGMRHRVEESQKHTTGDVARAVDKEVAGNGAGLLVLAGEVQSRSRLHKALGDRSRQLAVETDSGGRADGADVDELDREVRRLADARVTEIRRDALRRYEQAAGRADGQAVDGLDAVLEALRASLVDTLYIDAGTVSREPRLWIGPEPTQIAAKEQLLRDLGITPTGPVAADSALLRAAAGSDAAFHPVGGARTGLAGRPLADGVAAMLRGPISTG